MRYLLLTLACVASLFIVSDAMACAQCKYDSTGCVECLETPYDGGVYCELRAGRIAGSTICRQVGYCEGWGGDEPCSGSPCNPYQYYVLGDLPEKNEAQWQLASVTFLPPRRPANRS